MPYRKTIPWPSRTAGCFLPQSFARLFTRFSGLLFLLFLGFFGGACHRHRATPAECRFILERIVELELHELGFRDPVLAQRKSAAAQRTFSPDLEQCAGVRMQDGAMACVRQAKSVEEISHRCLR